MSFKISRVTAVVGATGVLLLGGLSASADAAQPSSAGVAKSASSETAATKCRNVKSKITGATVTGRICWNKSKVWASGMMYDTKGDKREACVKRYYVKKYASSGIIDCIDNSKPGKKEAWKETITGGKKYYIKACARNRLKTVCDSKWR